MSTKELDQLLDRMPQIAEAVGRFSSESVQSEVFRALINAFGTGTTDAPESTRTSGPAAHAQDGNGGSGNVTTVQSKKTASKVPAASKGKQSFSIDKTLDLIKGGRPPFKEFWESKKPTSVLEKCLVSVYWLTRLTNNPVPATVEQVYTCFKSANWAVPNDLVNTLQQAGTKGWLDTKKRDDIKVVVQGENHIEHEMPAKAKAA